MGYLYRPKLKDPEASADQKRRVCRHPDPERPGEKHPDHGHTDVCRGCGDRFSAVWWMKYYVNGKAIRESTEKATEAKRVLKDREGKAVAGQPVLPRVNRILYEEAAKDLRTHYKTTGERDLTEAGWRLTHLEAFFGMRRIASIGPADVTRYIAARQAEGATNGTVNRELGVLGRMLRLAYENGKLMRLPLIHKLKEAAPRAGFFERSQFEAVKRQLRPDLQVAVSIAYAFGWRMQSEVLALQRRQVDLNACTLRLEPGTTKNDEGRLVYLTPELVEMLRAQDERVRLLEMTSGKKVPHLFPYLHGEHEGKRIQDFRKAWKTACREAMLEGLEGEVRAKRAAELDASESRSPEAAPARFPAHGRAEHGQPRRARARGHEDHGPQDACRVRSLPHREPGGPAGGGEETDGHVFGHVTRKTKGAAFATPRFRWRGRRDSNPRPPA